MAGILDSELVVRREWLTYGAGSTAEMLSTSWTPRWALAAVPELGHLWPLPVPGGAAPMIAAATGQPLTWGWCAWEARLPRDDGREMPLLHLTRDSPCLGTVITWGTGDGETSQTIEYLEFVVCGNRAVEAELIPSPAETYGRDAASRSNRQQ